MPFGSNSKMLFARGIESAHNASISATVFLLKRTGHGESPARGFHSDPDLGEEMLKLEYVNVYSEE
jgi:hypothetical protein